MNEILKLENITKSFSGFYANSNVNITLNKGEIHTILGENGAGKSTLMNIITGLYRQDSGSIYIEGKKVDISTPADALRLGIGMVHQHFMLVKSHTVFENIVMSIAGNSFFYAKKSYRDKIKNLFDKFNINIDLDIPVWKLSIGEQQWVELVKLLLRDCNILILDEPTAVLTPQETEFLFSFLFRLKENGKSILFISHKMKEVTYISDKVTVLKKGEVSAVLARDELDERKLANLMISESNLPVWKKEEKVFESVVLKVENLNVKNDKGLSDLNNYNIELRKGEILGIAGIAGNGQKALSEALTGLRNVESGKIYINEIDMTDSNIRSKYISGVAHIPEDRKSMGVAPGMSIGENLILKSYKDGKFSRYYLLSKKKIEDNAKEQIEKFSIKIGVKDAPVRLLSGGNIQKVIIARELAERPLILVALYPTRGLDVGSQEYVHKVMMDAIKSGTSIILISEDIDELLSVSDRVTVMFRGENCGYVDSKNACSTELGLMMSGVKKG